MASEARSDYQKRNNTYSLIVNNDKRELLEVAVGDEKEEAFLPRLKLKKWNNEVNFSVGLIDSGGTHEQKGHKLEYRGNRKANFYDLGDGYEFEEILEKKPASNVLEYSIETKGLDFFYQPALTPEEIAEGSVRPENVIGSYAVYHKEKSGDHTDGKNYKAGKFCHVYRPEIIDAKGNKTWGVLNIDETKKLLTITIEQAWLDNAAYPVIVDPTLGYTGVGGSSVAPMGSAGSLFTSVEIGKISGIAAYTINETGGSDTLYTGIYSHANNARLTNGLSAALTIPSSSAEWRLTSFATQPEMATNTGYLLMASPSNGYCAFAYDTGSANQGHEHPDYVNSTTTFNPTYYTHSTKKLSIYAIYLPTTYQTIGYGGYPTGESIAIEDYIVGSKFTAPETGALGSMTIFWSGNSSVGAKGLVYDLDGNLLGVTAAFDTTYQGYLTANFAMRAPVTEGEEYILAVWSDNQGAITTDVGTTNQGYYKPLAYGSATPDPITWYANNDNMYSIYATYQRDTQGPVTILTSDASLPNALGVYELEGVRYGYDNYFKNANNWYFWHDTPDYFMLGTDLYASGTYISGGVGVLPDNPWEDWSGWGYDPPLVVWGREFDGYAGDSAAYALYAAYPKIGQSFTADATEKLTGLVVYLYDVGGPTGNIVAKLYAHSGTFGTSSVATGAALATSDSMDVAEFDGIASPKVFTFDGTFELQEGTNYCIVLEYAGGNNQNYVAVRYDGTSPTHAGNMFWWYQIGSYYYAESGKDLKFSIYRLGAAAETATNVAVALAAQSLTGTQPAPTILAQRNTTISLAAQAASVTQATLVVNAARNIAIALDPQTLTAGLNDLVISVGMNVAVALEAQTIQAALNELTIATTRSATIALTTQSLTSALNAMGIRGDANVTLDVLQAQVGQLDLTPVIATIFSLEALGMEATANSLVATGGASATLEPQVLNATQSELIASAIRNVYEELDPQALTSGVNEISIATGNSVFVGIDAQGLTAAQNALTYKLDNKFTILPVELTASQGELEVAAGQDARITLDSLALNSAIIDMTISAQRNVVVQLEAGELNLGQFILAAIYTTKPYVRVNPYTKTKEEYTRLNVYTRIKPYNSLKTYTKEDYDN